MATTTTLDFGQLPRGAQLLLAYIVYDRLDEVQLLKSDPDGLALLDGGWIKERPCRIFGVTAYQLSNEGMDKLDKIEDRVLSSVSEDELESYKDKKKAIYPWLW